MAPTTARPASITPPALPYLLVTGLTSLALLNAQVSVTRLLAYKFFYHFVFLVVLLAQFGLAAAATWLALRRRREDEDGSVERWLLAAGALSLVTLAAYAWLSPRPNLSYAKVDGRTAVPYLLILSALLAALNLCGGMALTTIFIRFRDRIGRFYASDLAGASIGCVAAVGLMSLAGPIRAFLVTGLLAAASAAILSAAQGGREAPGDVRPPGAGPRGRERAGRPGTIRRLAPASLLVVLTAAALVRPGIFDPNVRFAPSRPLARTAWTHVARVDAPRAGRYVIDGDASTDLLENVQGGAGFPEYEIAPPRPTVAIVGVGAGPELAAALDAGAESVFAVDINPSIIRWDLVEDREFNDDLFHQPNVEVRLDEGRHALRSVAGPFDLILMYAIDTWTASSQGAYSLTENFLYTTEAMGDFLSRLSDDGVVAIRRWHFHPPRETLRLFTTAHAALQEAGVARPEDHLVVLAPVEDWRNADLKVWGYLFLSRSPLGAERLARLDRFVESRRWSYIHRPGRRIDSAFSDFLDAPDKKAFYRSYPYIVRPARDASPFFFQFAPPLRSERHPSRQLESLYSGSSTMLLVCLLVSAGLAAILVGAPLLARRGNPDRAPVPGRMLAYFACLGVGFMAVELPAIQIMTLFLGHPTYALGVVLAGLLASAGVGSFLVQRAAPAGIRAVLAAIVALSLLCALALLPSVHALIHLPFAARAALTLVALAAVGVPLGMPFVAGVRLLDRGRGDLVAWAWAANGAASVAGSSGVMVLLVFAGSTAAFALSAACYACALAVVGPWAPGAGAGGVRTAWERSRRRR